MFIKVKIKKTRGGGSTKFEYPKGYDASKIGVLMYQNEGKNIEYCLARVADDFETTDDMVEITKQEAEKLIEDWADNDKDLKATSENTEKEIKATYKLRRKNLLNE